MLAAFGGLEHAGLAGFLLGAAALRVPVIVDGVIAAAAALVAAALAPDVPRPASPATAPPSPAPQSPSTISAWRPLVDLDLRLGEGSGAILALPLVQSAARILRDVATFDCAGVADKPH